MSTIVKTQQFAYLQNKAKHYDNLRKIKPTLNTFRTLSPPKILSSYKHSINMPIMKQYQQMRVNQALVNGILEIRDRNKKPFICQTNGYSRYNDSIQKNDRNRQSSIKFRDTFIKNQIDDGNNKLGVRLLKVKPSVGTITEWNKRNEANKSLKKIASRYGRQSLDDGYINLDRSIDGHRLKHRRILSIYSGQNNKFIPQQYRTFMGRDGSTVALRQKLFQLPKQFEQDYMRRQRSRRNVMKAELNWRFNQQCLTGVSPKPKNSNKHV